MRYDGIDYVLFVSIKLSSFVNEDHLGFQYKTRYYEYR